jgi:hypothetical protein
MGVLLLPGTDGNLPAARRTGAARAALRYIAAPLARIAAEALGLGGLDPVRSLGELVRVRAECCFACVELLAQTL